MDDEQNNKNKSSRESWRCSFCAFDNSELMTECEICDSPRKGERKDHLPKADKPVDGI